MNFTDLNFLSRFLPIVLVLYYLAPRKHRTMVLFSASMIFYALGDLRFLPVLLVMCVLNYFMAFSTKYDRKKMLAGIIIIDALTLFAFKILLAVYGIALPLGISFYIFKMLSFQADLFRGKIKERPSFIVTATYFSLFFQILQGPIMRYSDDDFAFERQRLSLLGLEEGLKYVITGLSMKVLIADKLAILWNEVSKIGYDGISTSLSWLAAIAYSLELYLDFWGYSLMAAGIGIMFGFRFVENFRHPYAADSIGEFFRRWHMTLTSWFRDYVYIPIGGSRNGRINTVLSILAVWLLTGFWHGGSFNFIIWGLTLGLVIAWEKFIVHDLMVRFPVLGHLHVLILMPIMWVVFAVSDLTELGKYLSCMIPVTGWVRGANPGDFGRYFSRYLPYICAGMVLCVPEVYKIIIKRREGKAKIAEAVILVILLWICLYSVNNSQSNPFLYFYF